MHFFNLRSLSNDTYQLEFGFRFDYLACALFKKTFNSDFTFSKFFSPFEGTFESSWFDKLLMVQLIQRKKNEMDYLCLIMFYNNWLSIMFLIVSDIILSWLYVRCGQNYGQLPPMRMLRLEYMEEKTIITLVKRNPLMT